MKIRSDNRGRPVNHTWRRFGRLLVLARGSRTSKKRTTWWCQCSCGNFVLVITDHLVRGYTKSCGCLNKELASRLRKPVHGHAAKGARGKGYGIYASAKTRCTNPRALSYPYYGGKGVEFRFKNFEEFLRAVGPRPGPEFTLDRINPFGHYEAGNCRWVTWDVQHSNTRKNYNVEAEAGISLP